MELRKINKSCVVNHRVLSGSRIMQEAKGHGFHLLSLELMSIFALFGGR
jgi:hypothetical protein